MTSVVVSTVVVHLLAGNVVQVEAVHRDGAVAVPVDVSRQEEPVAMTELTVTLDKSVFGEAIRWVVAKTPLAVAKVTINKASNTSINQYTFQIP